MASPDAPYRAGYDDGVVWNAETTAWEVSGWMFSIDDRPFALFLDVGDERHPLQRDVVRPDVVSAFGLGPAQARCGFAAQIRLRPGTFDARLVAVSGDAATCVLERKLTVAAAPLRFNVETPGPGGIESGTVRVSGWCFHPDEVIDSLAVVVAGEIVTARFGLRRDDVAEAVAGAPATCGFEAFAHFPGGRVAIEIEARLRSGVTVREIFGTRFDVRRPSRWQRLRHLTHTLDHTARRGVAWKRRHGRWPRPREWPRLARRVSQEVTRALRTGAGPSGLRRPLPVDRYEAWLDVNRWSPAAERRLRNRLELHDESALPLISVVMPVYMPAPAHLRAAVESVRAQVYARWELCIADDNSPDSRIRGYLAEAAASDERVRLRLRTANGNISVATNDAAALASGEILVFLDHDDLLSPDCLAEIALAALDNPDGDVFYSDDDKIAGDDRRHSPQFKPDWSPELLLSYMYLSHVFAVRRSLFDAVGGVRIGYEGSQDHDFALRASERARRVVHIPRILYHWRVTSGSTAESGDAKPASFDAGARAVSEALARRGSPAQVRRPSWAEAARIGVFAPEFDDTGPDVTIIIPTRNQCALLRQCVASLATTTYRNYRVLVVDNDSDDAETIAFLRTCGHEVLRVASPGGKFNFAYLNNVAARHAATEFLLFLNNDTQVIEPRWLSRMIGYAAGRGVGAVGARLLHEDGSVQHAGIVHGFYDGIAGPAFKNLPREDPGYLGYARVTRNYSAVTAACLLTPRTTFLAHGGFDETYFGVAYNDVDYGYRLCGAGLRNVYVAGAELYHYEGRSRGFSDEPAELANFRQRYRTRTDPYYSPHLSTDDEHFSIRPVRFETGPRPRRIRTLMCAFNLNWEGAPYSQFELTAGLARRGVIEPVVYSPGDGPLRRAYEEAGIPVVVKPHPLTGCSELAQYDRAVDEFAAWIASLDVSVVYGNTLQTFYAIDAARRCGLPSLWNPRESEPWREYFRSFGPEIERAALRCFQYPYRIVFVARATANVYAELDSHHNSCVIHNGLDRSRIDGEKAMLDRSDVRNRLGLGPDDVAVLLLGTVCERKGQHDAVDAWAALPQDALDRAHLFVVGDRESAYSSSMHERIAGLPPERRQRVHVVAETDDVATYFRAADVFLCTSRVESYPRVILEAMAWDLPIVTTPVFGIAEQVRPEVNALIYDPGDTVQLASHLRRLVVDDDCRARLARRSADVLATLNDFEQMVDQYARLFEEASLLTGSLSCAASRA